MAFFYLCKVLFSSLLQYNGTFIDDQNNSKYRVCAPFMSVVVFFKWRIKSNHFDWLQSTYDYGRQFLQASLVLRRTCRYELSPNYKMEEKLNNAWGDFSSAMAERGARLSVALMFHRSAEKVGQMTVLSSVSRNGNYGDTHCLQRSLLIFKFCQPQNKRILWFESQ